MKRIVILAVSATLLIAPSAQAATKISLSPQFKVSHKASVLTVTLSGLPATHGIYLQQCMAPKKANTAPTKCNPNELSKLWVSNVAADIAQGATSGKKPFKMHVDAYFKSGDCIHTTCVISASSDHNAPGDRSEDQVVKFRFS